MREIRGCSVIVAARGQVEQDRVGKYEFSALLPENHCCLCLCLHTTCAAAECLALLLLRTSAPAAACGLPSKDQQATTA